MTAVASGLDAPGGVAAHIRAMLPSLLPAERAVAEVLLDRPETVIEMSSREVAEAAGASRATVVRTSQSLGFSGYQQLRVMLARDLGSVDRPAATGVAPPDSVAGAIRATFAKVGESLPAMTALLADVDIAAAVDLLCGAGRVLVAGNGLSAPLAQLAAQRLIALGRPAEAPADALAQQVAARHLTDRDALLVISGSGANEATVRAARVARQAGAAVVLVTAFGRSPVTELATVTLVVGMRDPTFRDELTVTTRIPQFILIEALIAGVDRRLGPDADAAHAATMQVLAENLVE
jgi:DNA-binding MurR/RpiR family transcriptional regulator